MTSMTVFAAERLEALQDERRARLLRIADYLTSLPIEYPDPWDLFACDGVPAEVTERWASELLRLAVKRAAWPSSVNPFEVEIALDYLTGVRS